MKSMHTPINALKLLFWVTLRELQSYFFAPFSYLLAIGYLLLLSIFGIYMGHFFERGQADLYPFFSIHPYLHLLLIAALTMRLWAEERTNRSIELTLSLPVPLWVWVAGKNLGASIFFFVVLFFTFPQIIAVSYLGSPDYLLIFSGYLGSFLLAIALVSLGSFCSALTQTQIIAFILTLCLGFLLFFTQFDAVQDILSSFPKWLQDAVYEMSLSNHFFHFTSGLTQLNDYVFFILFTLAFFVLNMIVIELKK